MWLPRIISLGLLRDVHGVGISLSRFREDGIDVGAAGVCVMHEMDEVLGRIAVDPFPGVIVPIGIILRAQVVGLIGLLGYEAGVQHVSRRTRLLGGAIEVLAALVRGAPVEDRDCGRWEKKLVEPDEVLEN